MCRRGPHSNPAGVEKNVLLSIGVGTVCYMLLVQFVFL